jgi:hypothetical protein
MSGLMRRLTRGRAASDDEGTPQASAASEPVSATPDAQQGGVSVPANGSATDEPQTAVLAAGEGQGTTTDDGAKGDGTEKDATAVLPTVDGEAARDLPAGVDPAELATRPTSAKRSRLRRRLRYLRAVRELLLRDIGGFYYEAQRSEEGADGHRRLLEAKTARLTRLDEEVRDLETRLDEPHAQTILRQPGLGGTCPQCGELHGSDARFCPRCGTALAGRGARAARTTTQKTGTTSAPVPATASGEEAKATTASLWGRPKRPDPAVSAASDAPTQAVGESRGEQAVGESRGEQAVGESQAKQAASESRGKQAAPAETGVEAPAPQEPAAVAKAEEERA